MNGTLLTLISLLACGPIPEGRFDGECSDGVDNDGVGGVDCEDAGCAEACAASACRLEREVCINEFMSDNDTVLADSTGDYSDWIELHNPSKEGRSLDGFSISDDLEEPGRHALDGLSIPGGGYLLLWASGDAERGRYHLPFKLSSDGDAIGLYCDVRSPADELQWSEPQGSDVSTGRVPSCQGAMTPGLTPTPEAGNSDGQ